MDRDLVCGFHAVLAALAQGTVRELWVLAGREDQRMAQVLSAAAATGVAVQRTSRSALDVLVPGARHQGVVARTESASAPAGETDLEAIVRSAGPDLLLLVLDGVQDPHNLGACLRTANAAGVQAVIAPKDRAVSLTPVARKVASGAAEATPFFQVTNLARLLRELREAGVRIFGTSDRADQSLFDADLSGPVALVLGAEGQGMRRLTAELCDELINIPMAGVVESLNVSVAAGVCLYEACRQRRGRG